jgi:exopolysaccharide biosynthesis polyprenyl glycosylphosphotransferase
MAIVAQCEREQVKARIVPDMFQMSISRMDIVTLAGIPLIGIKDTPMGRLDRWLKRAIDFTVSLLALVLFAPLLGFVALMIKLDSEGPVFFRQERLGKGGRRFIIHKFRSMYRDAEERLRELEDANEADGPIFKMKDDPRITRVGKWLRRLSIDELPQFYNVLRGDMSIIGPRPPIQSEVDQYQEWHKRRLEVSPGITGLWAISGRSELSFDEMALLDIYYIENWSPALDTRIFFQTIPYVIFGRGAY